MKKLKHLIMGGILAAMTCASASASSLKVGQALPEFSARTLDGRSINSADLAGKVTIVHFWATWCSACREEMPALEALYEAHHKDGLEIIAISIEDEDDKTKVLDYSRNFSFPVALKSTSRVNGFGKIWALPASFFIDRKGILRQGDRTGVQKMDASSLETLIGPMLREN